MCEVISARHTAVLPKAYHLRKESGDEVEDEEPDDEWRDEAMGVDPSPWLSSVVDAAASLDKGIATALPSSEV